jgi:alanyl-tRNA synthetase
LYYQDAYATRFDARVVDRGEREGRPAVALDRTLFYPAAGGQLPDAGVLNGVPVIEVIEEGDRVVHVLERPVADDRVQGEIDWPRRYDHMQQHTGQHILSGVFVAVLEAQTVSFHMSADVSTIDVARAPETPDEWAAVEGMLRDVVHRNLRVAAYRVEPENVAALGLRKVPERSGPLRIVDIEGFDRTACGGTHCATTGELRLIQILDRRPRRVHGGLCRIPFVCGYRALDDYGRRIASMNELTTLLGASEAEVLPTVARLQEARREAERTVQELRDRVMASEAEQLLPEIQTLHGLRVLVKVFPDRDTEDIRKLAQRVVEREECVALFGGGRDAMQLVFARSDTLPHHMGTLMQGAANHIGGRGGGRPPLAMGGARDLEAVHAALSWAQAALQSGKNG